MSTTTQTPVVPPRPTRGGQDSIPQIPPRPIRRAIERSLSPSHDRFAPSPLNDTLLAKSPYGSANKDSYLSGDALERTNSLDLPSLGQEGMEYAAVEELSAKSQAGSSRAASPENTRTVGDDLKLHAPRPSLPAASAKQRVSAVTHTDSEKAASFGLGHAKKNSSVASHGHSSTDDLDDEEHGIPEIGVQVPMYPNAGDVQAPVGPSSADLVKKHHHRKRSAQLPPGSYGLHGHGVIPSDKLEQAYFSKHPELIDKELTSHHADRAQDFSRTSEELNKIVHETAAHGTGVATHEIDGTPSEQVGWQAIEETISRPASIAPKAMSSSVGSQSSILAKKGPEISLSSPPEDGVIHVDEPSSRRKSVMFMDEDAAAGVFDYESEAPILAPDEVAKDPSAYEHPPAVEPEIDHYLNADGEGSRPSSRPSSRPASIRNVSRLADVSESAVDDKDEEEYEPLFKDDEKAPKPRSISARSANDEEPANRFPSRDVWEEAPKSTFYTTEVSTPEVAEDRSGEEPVEGEPVGRRSLSEARPQEETPAQAFARHQEELAEQELQGADTLSENRKPHKPKPWTTKQSFEATAAATTAAGGAAGAVAGVGAAISAAGLGGSKSSSSMRPGMSQRFPSRDVWEETPESLQLQTVVSTPQQEEEVPSPAEATKQPDVPAVPAVPARPVRKLTDPAAEKAVPELPSRPKPKVVADKPAVPPRPLSRQLGQSESSSSSSSSETTSAAAAAAAARPKPAVPARPFGGKIAALQATFMSDLNKKLKIGPQAPKKEEPADSVAAETAAAEEAEKTPLVDARKGRARGPARRAPPRAAVAAATEAPAAAVSFGISTPVTVYSIDPEEGAVNVASVAVPEEVEEVKETVEKVVEPAETKAEEAVPEAEEAAEVKKVAEEPEEAKTEEEKTVEATPEAAAAVAEAKEETTTAVEADKE